METIRIAACDLNGAPRGKRLPAFDLSKAEAGKIRLPYSVLNVDIFGNDIADSPLVFASGDADGILAPTERGLVPMPWLNRASYLLPMVMMQDGAPFAGDPRNALAAVVARYDAKGLQVIAATELEFTLVDDSSGAPESPINPLTGRPIEHPQVNSLASLDAFEAFFDDLYDGAEAMGIPADTAISEAGVGQYEVNLTHVDAMRAADDAWLFKMLVRGIARRHGLAASFMAKPYLDDAGNGLHVHFSVLDSQGRNVFDDGGPKGSELLHHAVSGLLEAMPASTLIFAPHGPSYDRFVPGAHAPTGLAWGYDNRTTAIRIPDSPPVARRIEHRVAGGDINPYLLLAVQLGAALNGMEAGVAPPPPISGSAYDQSLPQIPTDWSSAIDRFSTDPLIAKIFAPLMIDNLTRTKRQELSMTAQMQRAEITRRYLTLS